LRAVASSPAWTCFSAEISTSERSQASKVTAPLLLCSRTSSPARIGTVFSKRSLRVTPEAAVEKPASAAMADSRPPTRDRGANRVIVEILLFLPTIRAPRRVGCSRRETV